MARIAILGRPNVGKSTLFNRLVGRKLAITDDRPGVTRDLRDGAGRLGDLRFDIVDTAGLEEARDDSLPARMRALSERAMHEADICLFVVDARAGITPLDQQLADMLRRAGKPVLVLANKAEGRAGEAGVLDAYALGLGEVIAVSAEHGEGFDELRHALGPVLASVRPALASGRPVPEPALGPTTDPGDPENPGATDDADEAAVTAERPLRIAVLGRPNAGKSTLVNAVLGEERLLTGPEAGITRDAIAVDLDWNGVPMRLFDTAGMRKKARVQDKLEKLSVADGLRAIRFAEVTVLVMDAATPFETQDLRLADLAEREGRAVVFAISKWDLEAQRQARMAKLTADAERLLPQLRGVPIVFLSALTGQGMARLHAAIVAAHEVWNRRIGTGPLNRWLADAVAAHPPPAPGGRRIRLRYITQVKARPPEFVIFTPRAADMPDSYRRYLVNGLRETFGLMGTPLRLSFRAGDNPYATKQGG
ncbi:MAG: ribosome biogenesis GTPase Der [Pseudomonadota bacterium]